jgi:chemotaxis family two-component system sensor kinase Cph1
MLQTVFANLITNAMKYNDKPQKWIELGALGPAAVRADRNSNPDHQEAVFYVKDNGIGIAAKHFENIFVMFQRLHGDQQYGGGTGLGLAITQKIIERHGGRIWLESEPGRGTTVYFTLPRAS